MVYKLTWYFSYLVLNKKGVEMPIFGIIFAVVGFIFGFVIVVSTEPEGAGEVLGGAIMCAALFGLAGLFVDLIFST